MFRKVAIIFIILLFAISFISVTGCGGKKAEPTPPESTVEENTATQQSATQTQPPPNPLPTTTIMIPISVIAGQPTFTMTLNGTGFVKDLSVLRWNGADRPTTYISDTQLTASIPASDMVNACTASVTVFNPGPGGGDSNVQTFTVNPVPAPQPPASVEPMVVVTRTGEKYHMASCRYVVNKTDTRTIPLSQAKAEGYTPCSVCNPPQ